MRNKKRPKKRKAASAQSRVPADRAAPGTPTRSEKTRARLVAAAIEEFASKGYHDSKVSDIVARAGMSQPAFYLYFRSKEALYASLVKRVHDELLAILAATRVGADLPRDAMVDGVRASVQAFLQYFVDNPSLSYIGYFQADTSATIRDAVVATISRNIAFEQGAGYLRKDIDPVFHAECYGGTIERIIQRYVLTGKASAAELAKQLSARSLRGMLRSETT